MRHLSAIDDVYSGVISDHRAATEKIGELDPVTEDLFIGQLRQLELFQWFIRAHLKDSSGDVVFRDAGSNGTKNGNGAKNGAKRGAKAAATRAR